ncbi:hypothetical protein ABZS71_05695 [Streptomyces sp. NPDC005393]|uniref:hypothetical protein n=1 Tax=Streptomyces sp. NPDC005393 TaxID=3157041 RepID=UPI0033A76897
MSRLLLVKRYARTGRTGPAREQLRQMESEFSVGTPALFTGMVAGLYGRLDCLDGEFERAQTRIREAVRRLDSLAHLVAPQLIVTQFLSAAWAKAHLDAAEDRGPAAGRVRQQ